MEGNYLLTYLDENSSPNFQWFDSEEELKAFIDEENVSVIDAIYIHDCENVFSGADE